MGFAYEYLYPTRWGQSVQFKIPFAARVAWTRNRNAKSDASKSAGFRHARQVGRRARIIPPAHSGSGANSTMIPNTEDVRATALASAFAAVAWTSFCIATAIVRLDSANFGQWRDWLVSGEPRITLSERLEAATLALREVSRQVLRPTVFVADSIGVADSALPLSMTVTNYTPETTIVLSKLVTGTTLTSGMSIGEREWRVDIDDLPNVRVVPPLGYVGAMTLVAELRGVDGQSFSLTPVRLTWSAPDGSPSPARNDPPNSLRRLPPSQVSVSTYLERWLPCKRMSLSCCQDRSRQNTPPWGFAQASRKNKPQQ